MGRTPQTPLITKRTSTTRTPEEPTATESKTLADTEVEAAMIPHITQTQITQTTQMKMKTGTRMRMRIMRLMVATEMETLRKPLTRRE